MYSPSLADMRGYKQQGNLCPIYREIMADLETPVSAYLKIARGPHSFLLESVEGGQHIARYSFLGSDPYMVLRLDRGVATATQGGYKQTLHYDDPVKVLGSYVNAYRPVRLPDLPRFVGGAVGYFSYETVSYFEKLPVPESCDYQMPEGLWMFVDTLLVFDHLRHKIKVVSHVHLDAPDLEAEYQRAVGKIEEMIERLRQPLIDRGRETEDRSQQVSPVPDVPRNYEPHSFQTDSSSVSGLRSSVSSNVTREQYAANVLKAKEYIAAGDIFQVVPSQRFRRPTSADSFTIYRALRTINPSPYMFYLRTGEGELVGASPEMLVRVQDGEVETHPIAGTRRRGRDIAEDTALAEELLHDEKERAEHLMLVDLGRNDVGRVSTPGSVRVPAFMTIEKYSHVMHIVSHVTGQLRPDMSALDALRACFPAGTVSGAPKIRAMEVIAELEGTRRGIYAGCAGNMGFNGDLDTCIALRTMVVQNGVAYVQAGGGVVADSDAEAEYQESCNKAAALLKAIDVAEELG
ncbi:MAG: anthranilate synthase component I [Chloroflexaceae bacterium]|nr:anthranilate synthase component I [Chloroflexaceae bacterium]